MSGVAAAIQAIGAPLSVDLSNMSTTQLTALLQAAQKEEARRKEEVRDLYGDWFCTAIGLDRLYHLPEVRPEDIGLANADAVKYPATVGPSHLKEHSAVRGVMGAEGRRPFVAIKLDILDPVTKKVVATVVELIFKRYGVNGDGKKGGIHEDNYVTALEFQTEAGERYFSCLYSSGSMSEAQVGAVKDLLERKQIQGSVGRRSWMQMTPDRPLSAIVAKS